MRTNPELFYRLYLDQRLWLYVSVHPEFGRFYSISESGYYLLSSAISHESDSFAHKPSYVLSYAGPEVFHELVFNNEN